MRGHNTDTISARQVSVGLISGGSTIFWGARPTGTNLVTGLVHATPFSCGKNSDENVMCVGDV